MDRTARAGGTDAIGGRDKALGQGLNHEVRKPGRREIYPQIAQIFADWKYGGKAKDQVLPVFKSVKSAQSVDQSYWFFPRVTDRGKPLG
jgi:hypothetical protein